MFFEKVVNLMVLFLVDIMDWMFDRLVGFVVSLLLGG